MAASIKIEFDDGSRVISQTLEDAAGEIEKQGLLASPRPESCSMDDFYEASLFFRNPEHFPATCITLTMQ